MRIWCFLYPMLSVGQQQKKVLYSSSLLVQEGVSFCLEGIIFSQSIMPQLDNSHNSSGHAFSSLLSIFPYAMMEMEYLGSAEFSNYGTNWFHTGRTTSEATTPRVLKISWEKVLAPVYPICTPVYSKYPNGVTPSTYWEKGGKALFSLVSEK